MGGTEPRVRPDCAPGTHVDDTIELVVHAAVTSKAAVGLATFGRRVDDILAGLPRVISPSIVTFEWLRVLGSRARIASCGSLVRSRRWRLDNVRRHRTGLDRAAVSSPGRDGWRVRHPGRRDRQSGRSIPSSNTTN